MKAGLETITALRLMACTLFDLKHLQNTCYELNLSSILSFAMRRGCIWNNTVKAICSQCLRIVLRLELIWLCTRVITMVMVCYDLFWCGYIIVFIICKCYVYSYFYADIGSFTETFVIRRITNQNKSRKTPSICIVFDVYSNNFGRIFFGKAI